MKILFSIRHPGALRNFASTVLELARRGHHIHFAFMVQEKGGDDRLLRALAHSSPNITWGWHRVRAQRFLWVRVARIVGRASDYVRYCTPEYEHADALRGRAARAVPAAFRHCLTWPLVRSRAGIRLVARSIAAVERLIPAEPEITDLIAAQEPDIVLFTPLVDLGSGQVEYLRAARALGLRTGLCVHSWDNLTNKGVIRLMPDRVFVWNDAQKREAVGLHAVAPDRVIVTGAPVFDQWFARGPSTTRAEFCDRVGLPGDSAFFLYVCSSSSIAMDEASFVERWIAAVRSAADPRVRAAGILVRPHPRADSLQWVRFVPKGLERVAVWPPVGANPVDIVSKDDYFDSMYHAVAVVGLNTTAQIEAAIVGRPVYSVRAAEYAGMQEGSLHFHHLLNDSGGLLHMADSLMEHVNSLASALDGSSHHEERVRTFVRGFVRPYGLDDAATPRLADGIEALGRIPQPQPEAPSVSVRFIRRAFEVTAAGIHVVKAVSLRAVITRLAALPARLFRWQPARRYARRHILRHVHETPTRSAAARELAAVQRAIKEIAAGSGAVIIGPWLNDIDTEVSYWIPFLNWVQTYRRIDPARIVVVSRSGAASCYQNLGGQYVDVLDFYTADEFRVKNERRLRENKRKSLVLTGFDRDVIDRTRERLGEHDVAVLPPAFMYRVFRRYWMGQSSLGEIERFASFRPVVGGGVADTFGLPASYIAVNFEFTAAFPDTDDNRRLISRVVDSASDRGDVVLLSSDAVRAVGPSHHLARVHTIDHVTTPRTALHVQATVVSGARLLIGSYGGVSSLAPLFGVTSLTFSSQRQTHSSRRIEWTNHLYRASASRAYVFDTNDIGALEIALGTAVMSEPPLTAQR